MCAGLYPHYFPWEESSYEVASFPKVLVYIIIFAQDQVRSRKHEKHGDLVVIYVYAGTRYLRHASVDQIIHRRGVGDVPTSGRTYTKTVESAIFRQQGCQVLIWRSR